MSAAPIAVARFPCSFCGSECRDGVIVARHVGGRAWCGACNKGKSARDSQVWARREQARIPQNFAFLDEDAYPRCHNDKRALELVEAWALKSARRDGRWLTITGATGFGKTTLAAVALDCFLEADDGNVRARWIDVGDLALARRNARLGREAKLVRIAVQRGLLVLDDVGSEPEDKTAAFEHVVMKRYAADRVTIMTTWLTREELAAKYGAGVARRLFERSLVIEMRGPQ